MGFVRSEDIIKLLQRQLGLDERTHAVLEAWEREAGAFAPYATVAGLKKGTLIVDVSTPVHFHELMLRRRELLSRINQYVGGEKVVKNIKIQLKK